MDCYLGEIRPFAGTYIPENWLPCDGRLLPITDNQALYALLGTRFGGDGTTTFGLPDLRGRLPIGSGQGPALTNRNFAQAGGSESVTLTVAQAPAHTHAFNVTTNPATSNSPVNAVFANPAPYNFYATTPASGSAPQVLNSDTVPLSGGANQAHTNIMPGMAVNYIIATAGEFPVQA